MDIMKLIANVSVFVNVPDNDEVFTVVRVALCRQIGDWLDCRSAEEWTVCNRGLIVK
jgi:hypothetical protein